MTNNVSIFDSFKILDDLPAQITVTNISNLTGKDPAEVASVLLKNLKKKVLYTSSNSSVIDLDNYDTGRVYYLPFDEVSWRFFAQTNGHGYSINNYSSVVRLDLYGVNFLSGDDLYNLFRFASADIAAITGYVDMIMTVGDTELDAHKLTITIQPADPSMTSRVYQILKTYLRENLPNYIDIDDGGTTYLKTQELLFSFWEE